jgi:hypothetical protein
MKINPISPIVFKNQPNLKKLWLKGQLPEVIYGLYGGILKADNITREHVKPRSWGGKTVLNNTALAVNINNWRRGNKPLVDYLSKQNYEQYLEQFDEILLPNFNGKLYKQNLFKTIMEALRMK